MLVVDAKVIGEISDKEVENYINYLEDKYKKKLDKLTIKVDGDYVDLSYSFKNVPFERIRRITGYLTGVTDTWNNAKKAELKDRVVHSAREEI